MTLAPSLRPMALRRDRDDGLMRWLLLGCGAFMLLALLLPVGMILVRSLQDSNGVFVGLANYRSYFSTGTPWQSMRNSLLFTRRPPCCAPAAHAPFCASHCRRCAMA
ncbi:MAG: hypothetical protein NTY26_03535 [Burkholderiales bacterium]|nr:hypothetical protein [Burkholderiales bacterium]